MKVVAVILTGLLVAFVQLPKLAGAELQKERWAFVITLVLGVGLAAAVAANWPLPQPHRYLEMLNHAIIRLLHSL